MTRKPILYDIHIEEYHVHRVMRQFGLYQQTPVPIVHSVEAHVHRWTRQGQPPGSRWADKIRPYVDSWAAVLDDVVFEDRPHSDEAFTDYLRWYLPRTRTCVVHIPPEAPIKAARVSETYHVVRDQNFAIAYDVIRAIESEASSSMGQYHDMTPAQHQSTLQKIVDMCKRFRRAVTCREDDTFLPPRSSGPVPVTGPSSRRSAPAAQSGPPPPPPPPDTMATPSGSAVRPTYVPRPAHLYSAAPGSSLFPSMDPYGAGSSSLRRPIHDLEYRQVGGTDDDEEIQEVDDLAQMEWVNTFFSSAPTQEVVGTSQLGGAPLATQDYSHVEQTPVPEQARRSTRQTIPPEPLTYSQHHTRAGQAAERHGRRRGGKRGRI
ncbi:hypothetical protein PVAP13_2NG248606 [Panicum virgatum]|uniref:Uncharacterized protein n=1 Tax=Panicum virgatum TaxID=38727 RepID=A0A8T0V944_PANVG|nr:hypothetical protein PVAP13_2NG248606 [Panicum virgatum]